MGRRERKPAKAKAKASVSPMAVAALTAVLAAVVVGYLKFQVKPAEMSENHAKVSEESISPPPSQHLPPIDASLTAQLAQRCADGSYLCNQVNARCMESGEFGTWIRASCPRTCGTCYANGTADGTLRARRDVIFEEVCATDRMYAIIPCQPLTLRSCTFDVQCSYL